MAELRTFSNGVRPYGNSMKIGMKSIADQVTVAVSAVGDFVDMAANRRIFLNTVAIYGRSLYALAIGLFFG